ncbi:MAG TPA: alcohol dehydrogenase catalytic domain-containing protein [Solirubrobacteraceae bacterium]|nr:alcohol dehydrogenase catalytic domain-containing protein [Solirubrobacteraceae bacterium]
MLVAPVKVGICGTDVHEYADGPLRTTVEPHPVTGGRVPQILGHEFAGTVVEVGPDVESLSPGQRVSVMPLQGCGKCAVCRAGSEQLCDLRAAVGLRHPWGGMAELALVQERQACPMPDSLSWEQGAMIEPAAVSWAAVQTGGVAPGQSVLVTGFGPIGALAALAAGGAGGDVLVAEPNPARASRAQELGLAVVDPRSGTLAELTTATFAGGVDVAIECSGVEAAIQSAMASLRPSGVVVQTGVPASPPTLDLRSLMLRGLSIVASVGYPLSCWPTVMDEVASGRYPVQRILSGEVALDDGLTGVFERLLDPAGDALKVVIDVSSPAA